MSLPPASIHPSLQFEAALVERLFQASHTTQRNPQQCLIAWDRCRQTLTELDASARHPDPNVSDIDRLAAITEFDRMLLKSVDLAEAEAESSVPSLATQQTWTPHRQELREICLELHGPLLEDIIAPKTDWSEKFDDAERYDEMAWRASHLEAIQTNMAQLSSKNKSAITPEFREAAANAQKLCSESKNLWNSKPAVRELATTSVATTSQIIFEVKEEPRRASTIDWKEAARIPCDIVDVAATPNSPTPVSIQRRLGALFTFPDLGRSTGHSASSTAGPSNPAPDIPPTASSRPRSQSPTKYWTFGVALIEASLDDRQVGWVSRSPDSEGCLSLTTDNASAMGFLYGKERLETWAREHGTVDSWDILTVYQGTLVSPTRTNVPYEDLDLMSVGSAGSSNRPARSSSRGWYPDRDYSGFRIRSRGREDEDMIWDHLWSIRIATLELLDWGMSLYQDLPSGGSVARVVPVLSRRNELRFVLEKDRDSLLRRDSDFQPVRLHLIPQDVCEPSEQ